MDNQIKNGKVIIDDFFKEISKNKQIDSQIVDLLSHSYVDGKFTDKYISNLLDEQRKNNENK